MQNLLLRMNHMLITVIIKAIWGNMTTICVTYKIPKLTPKNHRGLVQNEFPFFWVFFLLPPVRCWLYMYDLPNSKHGCVGCVRLSWTVLPSLISRAKAGDFHCFGCQWWYSNWVLQIVILLWGLYHCILATFQGLIDNQAAWKGSAIGRHDTCELWFCRLRNRLRSKQPGGCHEFCGWEPPILVEQCLIMRSYYRCHYMLFSPDSGQHPKAAFVYIYRRFYFIELLGIKEIVSWTIMYDVPLACLSWRCARHILFVLRIYVLAQTPLLVVVVQKSAICDGVPLLLSTTYRMPRVIAIWVRNSDLIWRHHKKVVLGLD